ncbi:ABC transporter substrate-binding protein [Clostridium sp. DJ247]|uniref:ABC transporter substrate-binding protein n=1 Tax=Clostridium sp. DJ247 TaxID=2726188 RepID=UPI001626A2C8|nr:ABC transporter substrate-binding protein [Clostridium sp. DJ247]MBC2578744.1 ABC transporter substrate-binding protein [Clostridium sp. DJ247]
MSKILKKLVTVTSALIMVAGLSACSTSQSSNSTSEVSSEKIQGAITLYTSQPDKDAQSLVEAFQKKYPKAKVNIFRSGTEEVISKLLAENEAGAVKADVLLVADSVTFESLKEKKLLMQYKSSELKGIPEQFVDKDGMYTGTKIISTGIVVNTKNVKDLPDSWNTILSENAKNKAIMPSPLYSGAAAYNVGVLTRTQGIGWEFYEKIKSNNIKVDKGNGGVLKAVASGEKDYGIIIDYMAVRAQKEGSPVKFIYPKEGLPAITEPIGIIESTKNAGVAKAFVDFVLSEEGQKLAADLGYAPIKDGVKAPEGLKAYKDLKVLNADTKELLKNREDDKKKFSNIFK